MTVGKGGASTKIQVSLLYGEAADFLVENIRGATLEI
jgi:hypothetical protein